MGKEVASDSQIKTTFGGQDKNFNRAGAYLGRQVENFSVLFGVLWLK